jgi:DNA-directed RNA polymerase specialized sigma24 family protein
MITTKLTAQKNQTLHFTKFKEGNEKGLEYFYELWYPSLYFWGLKYTKDDVNADCIVSEAFLRLWLFRNQITAVEQIERFVKKLTADGCKAYYKTSSKKFQRNMLRLDELENYQEFIGAEDANFEFEEATYHSEPDEEIQKQWEQVEKVIPKLNENQQLFIRLCIKYAFDYGRIAWHIGGISDYQVATKVEKTLRCLKAIITDTQKLEQVGGTHTFKFEGDVCEEQHTILRMRYELQYSFKEIAGALNLSEGYIQRAFLNAIAKVKKIKL